MYDPGFVSGIIGVMIGLVLDRMLQQIDIVCRYPTLFESLKDNAKYEQRINTKDSVRLREALQQASEIVKRGEVGRFSIISRFRSSKEISCLLSEIKKESHIFVFRKVLQQATRKCGLHQQEAAEAALILMADMAMQNSLPLEVHEADPSMTQHQEEVDSLSRPLVLPMPADHGDLQSTNRCFFCGFIGREIDRIVEHINIDLITPSKPLKYLKDQVISIKEIKNSVNLSLNGDADVRKLEELCQKASETIEEEEEAARGLIARYQARQSISRLISEIDQHMNLVPLMTLEFISEQRQECL